MNPRTTILKIEEIESASTDSKAGSASVTLNRKSQDDINNDLDDFKNPGNQSFSSRLHYYEQQPTGLQRILSEGTAELRQDPTSGKRTKSARSFRASEVLTDELLKL